MTPSTKLFVDMFEQQKKKAIDHLDRIERSPGFRMMEVTQNGQRDVTEEHKDQWRRSIDQWQEAIDYLIRHDP